jgi:PBSX family phage terminase large subunit
VVFIVGVRSQATQGGIWDKLLLEVLPAWKEGLGLKYTEEKRDEMQYRYVFVENMHGGWSKVVLVSLPWPEQVAGRIRGFEPSMVVEDEMTTLAGPVYFDAVIQQLGRRPGIRGPQQFIGTTNPDGPSHWVYKRFWEDPYQEAYDEDGGILSPKGEWDPRYSVYTLNVEENKANLPPGYYEQILEATRNDPVEYRRMVLGEWVDRPTGDAIFGNHFEEHHIVKPKKGKHVIPSPKFPVVVGYDLGQSSNAMIFAQPIVVKDKGLVWLVFDEIVHNNKKIPYDILTKALLRKMQMWDKLMGKHMSWHHISDDSAFNQFRAGEGSYDHLQIKRFSEKFGPDFHQKPIVMQAAPKFAGSKEARVRLTQQLLTEDRLLVSDRCEKVKQMFYNLQSEKVKQGSYDPTAAFKPKRSVHLHPFDALSYIFLEADLGRPKFVPLLSNRKVEIITQKIA